MKNNIEDIADIISNNYTLDFTPTMKWVYSSSKFKYNNKPVERRKATCETVLGTLKVYEAVNGRAFIQYIYIGFTRGEDGSRIPSLNTARKACVSIEIGIFLQETKWKELLNSMSNA